MAKTINLDQGSFLGKKDFTLEKFIETWEHWSLQIVDLVQDADWKKFQEFRNWVKEVAAKDFEKTYQEQQIKWLKKLKEKEVK